MREESTEVHREIPYAPEHGFRGLGDLYLPAAPEGAPAALVIHGGGWNAMDKEGLAGIARTLREWGYGAYNINYRLLDHAPWPACGEDCLSAARFLLAASHETMRVLDLSKILIVGASAGGHLAMMTGLRLPADRVRAIVSIAGVSDLSAFVVQHGIARFQKFSGRKEDEALDARLLAGASPLTHVKPDSPPLLCIHSTNDKLVPMSHSEKMVARYREFGARAELFSYAGPGEQHGIWREGATPHRLLAEPEGALRAFTRSV